MLQKTCRFSNDFDQLQSVPRKESIKHHNKFTHLPSHTYACHKHTFKQKIAENLLQFVYLWKSNVKNGIGTPPTSTIQNTQIPAT